jgi:hypothetical protein
MSGYTKPCRFCNAEIKMSNDGGKWLPYNLDGSAHECKDNGKSQLQPQTVRTALTLESLDARLNKMDERLKKVETLLFSVE